MIFLKRILLKQIVFVCRLMLKDFNGWSGTTLCVVWVAAILGIIYQYTFHEQ